MRSLVALIRNVLFLAALAKSWFPYRSVSGLSQRFVRLAAARAVLSFSKNTLSRLGIESPLQVRPFTDVLIQLDGVWLDIDATDRYLKVDSGYGNDGRDMLEFLVNRGIRISGTVLDLGANVGEVSLFFAKNFPSSRIISVEPNPRNLRFLEKHMSIQDFSTARIEVVEKAVWSESGRTMDLHGEGASASLVTSVGCVTPVTTISLPDLWSSYDLGRVSFVKVDIEGAEPELLESMGQVAEHSDAWLIEFGSKAPRADYVGFLKIFLDQGFLAAERGGKEPFRTFREASEYFLHGEGRRPTDVWFWRDPT